MLSSWPMTTHKGHFFNRYLGNSMRHDKDLNKKPVPRRVNNWAEERLREELPHGTLCSMKTCTFNDRTQKHI